MKTLTRTLLQPESKVELQHVQGYTAYLFHHILFGYKFEIELIEKMERNLELIIDADYGDIYAFRFDYPPPIAECTKYFGTWVLTEEGKSLDEDEQLRVKLLCNNWGRN